MKVGDVVQLSQKTVDALTSLGLGDEAEQAVGVVWGFSEKAENVVLIKWVGSSIEYPVHISLLENIEYDRHREG